ncbi:sulfotransferase family 2 domain-containing protein [Teredinibacter turnerae]|uniref:sulfotransferase family 2 domain-containing protein n=1 Tax=Teredinibacter turnerae TaxID=2426 RepID=UPI000372ED7B|nr:sulfotransferase family 2 domain-containing protein [Teredinibacter turnerae]
MSVEGVIKSVYRVTVPYWAREKKGNYFRDKRLIQEGFVKNKAIFVHIPKAAGSSVAVSLYGHDKPGHIRAKNYIEKLGNKKIEYLIFSFVREPIDRFLSAYAYLKAGGKNKSDLAFRDNVLVDYSDVNDFVALWLNEKTMWEYVHFIPQTYYLYDDDDFLLVDFIGRYENLEEDFKRLALIIGRGGLSLPHANKTKQKNLETLNENSMRKLRELYKRDIKLLGYSEHENFNYNK